MTSLLFRRISAAAATATNASSPRLFNAIPPTPPPSRGWWQSHVHAFVQRTSASRTPTRTGLLWKALVRRGKSTITATHTKTSVAAPKPPPNRGNGAEAAPLAHRLLIYYAGKRTVYLGTLKLYTVMLFSYASLIVAPPLFRRGCDSSSGGGDGDGPPPAKAAGSGDYILPYWAAPVALILGSLVPLVFVQYISPPYVTHAYMHLPPWAAAGKQSLMQYLKKLPRDAELDLATIRWFGRPKVSRVRVGDLRPCSRRWGCVNTVALSHLKQGERLFYVDWNRSPAPVALPEAVGEVGKALRRWEEERRALGAR